MNASIQQIAQISLGITFYTRMKPAPSGNLSVIQFRDLGGVGSNYRINLKTLIKVDTASPKTKDLVQPGDLIFRSRGESFNAAILDIACDNTIIAAPLFRIRVNPEKVIPEYLLWFINQPTAQAYFIKYAEGTQIKMINKTTLGNLPVILPPIDQQRTIAELCTLVNEEQILLESIRQQRQRYMQSMLIRMANE